VVSYIFKAHIASITHSVTQQCIPADKSSVIPLSIVFFTALTSVIIKSFIYPTECTTRLKFTLQFYIKMLLHVSVNKPSSGSLLLCFAKVLIIKIVS